MVVVSLRWYGIFLISHQAHFASVHFCLLIRVLKKFPEGHEDRKYRIDIASLVNGTFLVSTQSGSIEPVACDFQQFDILTSVDSDEPLQPHLKLRTSKRCSVSSLTLIDYSSDEQRL